MSNLIDKASFCEEGDEAELRRIIEAKADLDEVGGYGGSHTALSLACSEGCSRAVLELVEAKADPNKAGSLGTPLEAATKSKDNYEKGKGKGYKVSDDYDECIAIVTTACGKGRTVKVKRGGDFSGEGKKGSGKGKPSGPEADAIEIYKECGGKVFATTVTSTATTVPGLINKASFCEEGDEAELRRIIEAKADLDEVGGYGGGHTALSLACSEGCSRAVLELVEAKADPNKAGSLGTPLEAATKSRDLYEKGKGKGYNISDDYAECIAIVATACGNGRTVKVKRGGDFSGEGKKGSGKGKPSGPEADAIEIYKECGGKVFATTETSTAPMTMPSLIEKASSCEQGDEAELRRIIEATADLDEVCLDEGYRSPDGNVLHGHNALSAAIGDGRSRAVLALVEAKADPMKAGHQGTALEYAMEYSSSYYKKSKEIREKNEGRGYNVSDEHDECIAIVATACGQGRTVKVKRKRMIVRAPSQGGMDDLEVLREWKGKSKPGRELDAIEIYKECGGEVFATSLIDKASFCTQGDEAELRRIIEAKADLDEVGAGGHTALSLACRDGRSRAVLELVEAKADPNKAGSLGTPLEAATKSKDLYEKGEGKGYKVSDDYDECIAIIATACGQGRTAKVRKGFTCKEKGKGNGKADPEVDAIEIYKECGGKVFATTEAATAEGYC